MRFRRYPCLLAVLALCLCGEARGGAQAEQAIPAAPTLVTALSGEDARARFLAEEGLVAMGDEALPAIEPLAASRGLTPARQHAIHVVGHIGTPKAAALLLRILERDPDVRARGLVCLHLGRMGVEDAVPVIGKWLLTIRRKSLDNWDEPVVLTPTYEWMRHVYALREIGSEKGIPILEEMLKTPNPGRGGKEFVKACQEALQDLRREAAFWKAVRGVPGLERDARRLFDFCRRDDLAVIRLYRTDIMALGLEGRWALETLTKVKDDEVRLAAERMLKEYDGLARAPVPGRAVGKEPVR